MTRKEFDMMLGMAERLAAQDPRLRRGQCLYLALHAYDKELAEAIRDTDSDPFYDDVREQAFMRCVAGKIKEAQ